MSEQKKATYAGWLEVQHSEGSLTRMKPLSLKLLHALALLEAGKQGLRQEAVYPPVGVMVKTCNHRYTDGNLRNQASHLNKDHGIKLANWCDPYRSEDGRCTQYHRYAIPNRETAEQVLVVADHLYQKATGHQLSTEDKARLLVEFPA